MEDGVVGCRRFDNQCGWTAGFPHLKASDGDTHLLHSFWLCSSTNPTLGLGIEAITTKDARGELAS